MLRNLFLILLATSSTVFAQQADTDIQKEKPKSYLFDQFGKVSQREIKLRTLKLREKLEEPDSKDTGIRAFLIFYSTDETSFRKIKTVITKVLYDNCLDCYGYHGGFITFVDGGKSENQKVQFWLSPRGAEPPNPEN